MSTAGPALCEENGSLNRPLIQPDWAIGAGGEDDTSRLDDDDLGVPSHHAPSVAPGLLSRHFPHYRDAWALVLFGLNVLTVIGLALAASSKFGTGTATFAAPSPHKV